MADAEAATVAREEFTGFPERGLAFLSGLAAHNEKAWFTAHRTDYDDALLAPAKAFVVALGDELNARVGPGIRAEPRVNGSIFRINRDIRFTADKTPYKTHLDMFLWQGEGPSRQCPGYFLRITPEATLLGAGMHGFSKEALEAYRDAIVDPGRGDRLIEITGRLSEIDGVALPEPRYARLPRGYEAEGARSALLRMDRMHAGKEHPLPAEFTTPRFVTWCAERLEPYAPLQAWLVEVLEP